jgi:large subunit ribosomal protein L25
VAETYTLDARPRTVTGKKVSQLRNQGLTPAVIYGAHIKPIHIQIPARVLESTLRHAGGTHLITMNLESGNQLVITREVRRHIIKGTILHVDFLAVDASTKLTTTVPIRFINESPALKNGIGVLMTGASSLEVEALPADLIDHVDVDLSSLENINDSIYVRDLNVSDKVAILTEPDDLIVRVIVQQVVEEELPEAEVTAAEPELIKRGKEEEEEGEEE